MMKSKSKFMIKYLWILLIIGLTGCHSEPQFHNPIKPTENKRETIKNWMSDFKTNKEGIIESYQSWGSSGLLYHGDHMPFDFYGPVLPHFLQTQKYVCTPEPSNYPITVFNHRIYNKKSVFVFDIYYSGVIGVYIGDEIKAQCDKSYKNIKNQYLSFIQDGIIDENEYKQLNNIYLQERNKIIDTINTMNKLAREESWKEKNLDEYNAKNGVDVLSDE